jgi:hypothetical protein
MCFTLTNYLVNLFHFKFVLKKVNQDNIFFLFMQRLTIPQATTARLGFGSGQSIASAVFMAPAQPQPQPLQPPQQQSWVEVKNKTANQFMTR